MKYGIACKRYPADRSDFPLQGSSFPLQVLLDKNNVDVGFQNLGFVVVNCDRSRTRRDKVIRSVFSLKG